jgi:hypothetical protein
LFPRTVGVAYREDVFNFIDENNHNRRQKLFIT